MYRVPYQKEETLDNEPMGKQNEARYSQTPDGILVHATTVDNLDKILKEGLKPRSESFCQIWGEDIMPYRIEGDEEAVERVLACRDEHVYFWDDYYEGVGQALTTVGYLKEKDPALLIVNVEGMKAEKDPEIEGDPNEDPVAYMIKGNIPPENIKKVCTLKEELLPSVGNLMCWLKHPVEQCPLSKQFEEIHETFSEMSNWVCTPAKDFKRG